MKCRKNIAVFLTLILTLSLLAGWDKITAVKNKAMLNLRNNELSRSGPRLTDGAKLMFDLVYTSSSK